MCEPQSVIYQNHHFGFKIFWLNKNLFFLDSGCLTMFLKSLKFASSNQRDSKNKWLWKCLGVKALCEASTVLPVSNCTNRTI